MAEAKQNGSASGDLSHIPCIPLSLSADDPEKSALALVTALRPDWKGDDSSVDFVRFTDGITNTLLKAVNRRPGLTASDADKDAILLRAYGNGTDVIIDRQRETQNHELLSRHGLAPELLARFDNGIMYRFIRGRVTSPADMREPRIYRAVARRLAQWHAVVPCVPERTRSKRSCDATTPEEKRALLRKESIDSVVPAKPAPNVWTVMQKWIFALPAGTDAEKERQRRLQEELNKLIEELSLRPGLGKNGLVFAHCDLLSGNVIILPKGEAGSGSEANGNAATVADDDEVVNFIDYEYATPSPAAFDIANHFAEWGGFDCDYAVLPTRSQRKDFIRAYARAYFEHAHHHTHQQQGQQQQQQQQQQQHVVGNGHAVVGNGDAKRQAAEADGDGVDEEAEVERLAAEVDLFRGVPGFYWGIWALIQAGISQIKFDYASYAETRLGEYWAWRGMALDGSGGVVGEGAEMPLRERRWAQEE